MILKTILLTLIFQLCYNCVLNAQSHELRIEQLNAATGLSHNTINCIIQDYMGFLWIGIQNGLNKYDGYSFTICNPVFSDSNSISHRHITALFEDSEKKSMSHNMICLFYILIQTRFFHQFFDNLQSVHTFRFGIKICNNAMAQYRYCALFYIIYFRREASLKGCTGFCT